MSLINNIVLSALSPVLREFQRGVLSPEPTQRALLERFVQNGRETLFGRDHHFGQINNYADFVRNVPIRTYDDFVPYIERLRRGEDFILWNEKVKWFARSSGTSSDKSKYIPITPSNLQQCHYRGFKTLIGTYLRQTPQSRLFNGKSLTLGGSVTPDVLGNGGIFNGDLSAILLKNSPKVVEIFRTPSQKDAVIADFEEKVARICEVCSRQNVTNFSGVPSWNLIMVKKLLEYNNVSTLDQIWPNIELFNHGGISFRPYKEQFKQLIPSENMHYRENYNASEGYFAVQDDPEDDAMTLTFHNGVFYEFVPMSALDKVLAGESDEVYPIEGVKTGIQYAIVITTNSGLWRYLIGDCVEFTSVFPHKIIITGRTKLFINAFGEELMIHNAENALHKACRLSDVTVTDFTVAPLFMNQNGGKGAHQWCIEFSAESSEKMKNSSALEKFTQDLDNALREQNSDYDAKRSGDATMTRLQITPLPEGTFYRWMSSREKVGGQNKVPRLSPEREFVEALLLMRNQ